MGEWREYKLGEVVDFLTGFPFKGEKYEMEGNLKVVRGENVTTGTLRWDTEKYWNHSFEELNHYFLKENDIVIGMDGSKVGQNRAIIRRDELPLILAQRVARIRAKKDFDQKFIWYQIINKNFFDYIDSIYTGTSIPHISPTQIKDFEFIAPNFNEQHTIATILSSLDDKIDLLHRQNKTLEALAETLFRQWFVEEADESWETKRISDVAEINRRTLSKEYPFSEIGYLDTGSITKGIISEFQIIPLDDAPSRAQRIVQENDILYSLVRPIQRHYGILHNVKPNFIASTGFAVITCTKINPYFIYLLITQEDVVEYFDSIAEGSTSTYPSLKPSDIANFEFVLPDENKMRQFSESSSITLEKIRINQVQIRTLTQLRDTLLPKLISGKVRVKI